MKSLLFIVFLLGSVVTFGQKKNDLYADVAISTLGGSATYDWRSTKHLAVGGGANIYYWDHYRPNLKTALYADVRPYWRWRRGLLFVPLDLGIAFYSDREPEDSFKYATVGVHFTLGIGYSYRVTRRGAGPYATFVMRGYSITGHGTIGSKGFDYGVVDAVSVLSVGFKF